MFNSSKLNNTEWSNFIACLVSPLTCLDVEMHFYKIKTDRGEILNFLVLQRWQEDQVIEFKSFARDIEFLLRLEGIRMIKEGKLEHFVII